MKDVRSVSLDTSFLLKKSPNVNKVLDQIKHDRIGCYITSTVISELDLLKFWERIDLGIYKMAMSRWRRIGGKVINFNNRFLSTEIKKECVYSMGEHHGVKPEDILNDCNILVETLKNGVDVFLSEDFHFTSRVTLDVLDDIKNHACTEYHQMCGEDLYCVDTQTFLAAYDRGKLNLEIIEARRQNIKKSGKRL
jgi:rRNA-processing protein FCF1